jgi:hypothetical protein
MSDDTKKQLFALMAHAEEQQKALDKAMETINRQQEQMEKLQKNLPVLATQLFQKSLNDARASISDDMGGHASKVAGELKKASDEAVRASQAIKKEAKTLDWKHAFMTVGAVMGTCFLIFLASMLWIPSLEDIAERRAAVETLNKAGGEIQTANCNGEVCARVMTKKCGFGDTKDYCVLDLKD